MLGEQRELVMWIWGWVGGRKAGVYYKITIVLYSEGRASQQGLDSIAVFS